MYENSAIPELLDGPLNWFPTKLFKENICREWQIERERERERYLLCIKSPYERGGVVVCSTQYNRDTVAFQWNAPCSHYLFLKKIL